MMPAFKPGDHVLAFNWVSPKVGDVIVFEKDGKMFLKRVKKINKDLILVTADNYKDGVKFGPIKRRQLIGKIVMKY